MSSGANILRLVFGYFLSRNPASFAPENERLVLRGPTSSNMSSSLAFCARSSSFSLFFIDRSCFSVALLSYSSRLLSGAIRSMAYSKKPLERFDVFWSSAERISASLLAFVGFPPDDFDSESDCDSTVLETGLRLAEVLGLFMERDIVETGVYTP